MVGDAFVICGGEGVRSGQPAVRRKWWTWPSVPQTDEERCGTNIDFLCGAGCQQEVMRLLRGEKLAPVI